MQECHEAQNELLLVSLRSPPVVLGGSNGGRVRPGVVPTLLVVVVVTVALAHQQSSVHRAKFSHIASTRCRAVTFSSAPTRGS